MPDVLTHILFAEKVRDMISDANINDFIDKNLNLFYLGAQGPDILFYYKPWNPIVRHVRTTGENMHHNETAKLFVDAIVHLNKSTGKEYEELIVYVIGFLCHYYCDKSAHPYIYSMLETGCYRFDGTRRKLNHYDIEATIDVRLWSEEKRITASETNNSALINTKGLPDSIANFLSKYICDTQPVIVSADEIKKAVDNMVFVLKFLYDPKSRKKNIINKLPLPRKCYIENGFPKTDVMNIKKRVWFYPGDTSNPLHKSVGEILISAADECATIANAICSFLENGVEADFGKLIPNQDYCTEKTLQV